MEEPQVTVVVVAREGFHAAPSTLECLYRTSTPFKLVYVDGGAPARISRSIRQQIERRGGTLIRTDQFLRPTRARNLGFS